MADWLEVFRAVAFGTYREPARKAPRPTSEPRRCECGKLLNGRHSVMCEECSLKRRKERAGERYARTIADGLCVRCRKPLPEGWTKTKCPDCTAASSQYRRTHKQEQENSARKREKAVKAGACPHCWRPSDRPGQLCTTCLENHRKNQTARRQKYAEAGLCTSCGKVSVVGTGRKKCPGCSERNREYIRRYKEKKKEGLK